MKTIFTILTILLLFALVPATFAAETVEVETTFTIWGAIFTLFGAALTITVGFLVKLYYDKQPQLISIYDNLETSVEDTIGFEVDPFRNKFILAALALAKKKYPEFKEDAIEFAVEWAMRGLNGTGPLIGEKVGVPEQEVRYAIEGAMALVEEELGKQVSSRATKTAK